MDNDGRQKKTRQLQWEMKPTGCSKCGGEVEFRGHGEYRCKVCGNVETDDFGKVKKYLNENGPTPALIIAENTGVGIDRINQFLKQGRVEIPENSEVYIRCEKCGTEIRFGRFCPACASKLSKDLKGVFEVGEVPKRKSNSDGKMHFLDREGNGRSRRK